ncbi:MAG TPA: hypothetical protein VN650_01185 [Gemmatimonadaceae bacterium]|jgi:hypothetical protein|nr:hypothetical protein [Gemmatimonadaceae bacterium]
MNPNEAKVRAIHESIRQNLLQDWDPIGVRDAVEAQDEYDGYVGSIYRVLASDASTQAIAEHLARTQTDAMGLHASARSLLPVAVRLKQIDVALRPA